jgi:two-component system cell cycle response regulator
VVLVTALDGRADRITGLEAGADEFLTKPIDDVMLFSRVQEPDAPEDGDRRTAPARGHRSAHGRDRRRGRAKLGRRGRPGLIVDDNERQAGRIAAELTDEHRPIVESDPEKAPSDRQAVRWT